MKFSIIVPVYNVANYLEACLSSIIQQTYSDFEVLLVNDGSTDASLQICQRFKEKYAEKIQLLTQENQGVSAARNAALNQARGKYIVFIDADDTVNAQHLEFFLQAIEPLNDKMISADKNEIVGVFNEIIFKTEAKMWASKISKTVPSSLIGIERAIEYVLDVTKYQGWPVNKLFKRDVIEKYAIRFNEQVHYSEDTLFCVEYLMALGKDYPTGKVKILQQPTYVYNRRSNSATKQLTGDFLSLMESQRLVVEKTKAISPRIDDLNHLSIVSGTAAVYYQAMKNKYVTPELTKKMCDIHESFIRDFFFGLRKSATLKKKWQFARILLLAENLYRKGKKS